MRVRGAGLLRAAFALATSALLPGGPAAAAPDHPTVPPHFSIERIASIPGAREITVAPNGDLLVGTLGFSILIVPHADSGSVGRPRVFANLPDAPAAGVTLGAPSASSRQPLFVGSQFAIWRMPYQAGNLHALAAPQKIASVRASGISRDHMTTTVAFTNGRLYASVGSSCDVCDPELDATRATIQEMSPDGTRLKAKARHIRNAIALAVNPTTGSLWAGVAGQDELAADHPYEIFDPVTLHAGVADYGWPYCYDNHRATSSSHNCSATVIPRVIFPAYETPIGAVFYPLDPKGKHAFPRAYWGGAFVTMHGSWHQPPVPPRITFVPMRGDSPQKAIDWSDPAKQWTEFVGGFQTASGDRSGRPTGITVGPQGDVFFADDLTGAIYRVRPT